MGAGFHTVVVELENFFGLTEMLLLALARSPNSLRKVSPRGRGRGVVLDARDVGVEPPASSRARVFPAFEATTDIRVQPAPLLLTATPRPE
jgi:hypothetical protein